MTDDSRPPDSTGDQSNPGAPLFRWQPPDATASPSEPEQARKTTRRLVERILWVLGILAVLFFGRIIVVISPSTTLSSFERGTLVGTMVGAVLFGLVVRWIWVRVRKRGEVWSPWILVLATVLLVLSAVRIPGSAAPSAAVPIATYLRISAPYSLAAAPPDATSQFGGALTNAGANETAVRAVMDGSQTVGYLVVSNLGTTSSHEFMNGFAAGFEENAGSEAHAEVVDGKDVVVGTGPQSSTVIWTEPPYGLIVYAADADSGKVVAASIMDAHRSVRDRCIPINELARCPSGCGRLCT